MGDADDSYDFTAIAPLIEKLRDGCDLVMGNRFTGGIRSGAMTWSHRWVGNPALTRLSHLFFRTPVGHMHCGLRAFRKDAIDSLHLRATGTELDSTRGIKASLRLLRIAQLTSPLTPHPPPSPPL